MLAEKVSLHDVCDVEGFVRAAIQTAERRGTRFPFDEREELVCAGICIMCELAKQYEPHRPGYAQAGTFAGYAAMFLPRRLGDVWHSWHPEHHYITGVDGKRAWQYESAPSSLDDDERALEVAAPEATSGDDRIDRAIATLEPFEQIGARELVRLHDRGFGMNDIAQQMNCSREQLRHVRIQLAQAVIHTVEATAA